MTAFNVIRACRDLRCRLVVLVVAGALAFGLGYVLGGVVGGW